MIGQNDVLAEILTVEDAIGLNEFASSKGLVRLSMWSANRDIPCGQNYVNLSIVSDSCSGIKQDNLAFTRALGKGFDTKLTQYESNIISEDSNHQRLKSDDPATSPYQIWQQSGTYLANTKVVWHQNVYQAKWWTRGDIPDNPVLEPWQTPWKIIGPVLPGEKPIPPATLPPGTYPAWDGKNIYNAGQRVLLKGIPYQTKWWTQGDSPVASFSDPDGSPWLPLTQDQIKRLTRQGQ